MPKGQCGAVGANFCSRQPEALCFQLYGYFSCKRNGKINGKVFKNAENK